MPDDKALVRIDPQSLLRDAVSKGAQVETLERLLTLAKEVRAEQAREAWFEAMTEFQRTCPPLKKTATAKITSRRGGTAYSYHYAPLDKIMPVVTPIMAGLGLSISWKTRMEQGYAHVACRVAHRLGHYEDSGEISMPIGQDADGATAPQRVGIARTYAARYALLGILGLSPEDDDDAEHADDGDSTGSVAMPKRASETAAAREPGDDAFPFPEEEHPTQTPAGIPLWQGLIDYLGEKPTKGKNPKYSIKGSDGTWFNHFSRSVQDAAKIAHSGKLPVEIAYEVTQFGKDLISLRTPAGTFEVR